jgi:hypothetical protein
MYQDDLSIQIRLARAGLVSEEADYIGFVAQAASLERQALELDIQARLTNNCALLEQAECLRSQSRAILFEDLPTLKAGIDARRQILGVSGEK